MPTRGRNADTHHPRRARLFRNGRSQAVRIPKELELPGSEVTIRRERGYLIVEPVNRPRDLAEILPTLTPLEEDFPIIEDPVTIVEDPF